MRISTSIALAIVLFLVGGNLRAQSAGTHSDSDAGISGTPARSADDPEFSSFQLVTPGMKPPKATSAPDPKFPDLPDGAEPRGNVVLLIGVSAKGRVEAVRVVRSDEQAFEKSAVATVRRWRFKPAEKDGHPVPVQITVEMHFAR